MLSYPSLLTICLAAGWSGLVALGSLAIYMRLPARWLCEYGEDPEPAHEPAHRCGGTPAGRRVRAAAAASATLVCLALQAIPVPFLPDVPASQGYSPAQAALLTIILICLVVAALSDVDYLIIPDQIPAALLVLAVIRCAAVPAVSVAVMGAWSQAPATFAEGILQALSGAALAAGAMLLAALPSRLICGSGALGFGDIKLLAACGAVVGASGALLMFVITVFSSAIFLAAGLVAGRFELRSAHPMAPWIAAATVVCMPVL